MTLTDRIGIDVGRKLRLEDAVEWAARNAVRFIDIQLDAGENAFTRFDDARRRAVRSACERHGVHLGLHTLSAVNVAEYSPILSDAVDDYLRAYIDIAPRLGAEWIVVHAGYHFTADVRMRDVASAHIDGSEAEDDVRAAVNVVLEADLGSEDAQFVVDQAEGHELAWYARQEIGVALELL